MPITTSIAMIAVAVGTAFAEVALWIVRSVLGEGHPLLSPITIPIIIMIIIMVAVLIVGVAIGRKSKHRG